MEHEIIKSNSDVELQKKEQTSPDELMCIALDKVGADELFLAEGLIDVANNAYTMTMKGDVYPDYNSRLQALKEMRKIRSNKPDVQINIANVFGNAGSNL